MSWDKFAQQDHSFLQKPKKLKRLILQTTITSSVSTLDFGQNSTAIRGTLTALSDLLIASLIFPYSKIHVCIYITNRFHLFNHWAIWIWKPKFCDPHLKDIITEDLKIIENKNFKNLRINFSRAYFKIDQELEAYIETIHTKNKLETRTVTPYLW